MRHPHPPQLHQHFPLFVLFVTVIPTEGKRKVKVAFICISLQGEDVEPFLKCLLATCSYFKNSLINFILQVLIGLFQNFFQYLVF